MTKEITIITGAAGFIGSCLVAFLNERNRENLLLVDDLKSKIKWKNLVGKRFLDLISKNDLFDFIEKNKKSIASIVHLGACSDTLETDCDYLLKNNFHYSVQLAKIALKEGYRFIYASSAATYGDGALGFSDDLLSELRPINMYAFSKHLFDLWAYRERVSDRMVGLKYFNVFGPNEYHKGHMASMIFKMAEKAKKGETIKLYKSNDPKYADGEQMRDFIYVKDAVNMTALFLDELGAKNGLFNIGRGEPVTWNEVANALFFALQKSPKIEYIDMPESLSLQYQNYTCADMKKFRRLSPSFKCFSIKDAVRDYVQNYLIENKTW